MLPQKLTWKDRVPHGISASTFGHALGLMGCISDWVEYQRTYIYDERLRFKGNEATEHGIRTEATARTVYEMLTRQVVDDGGFFIYKGDRRLACSPDGIIWADATENEPGCNDLETNSSGSNDGGGEPTPNSETTTQHRSSLTSYRGTETPSQKRRKHVHESEQQNTGSNSQHHLCGQQKQHPRRMKRLLEIKSPFAALYDCKKYPPFGIPPQYMCQMQGQMAITGCNECDFFVYLHRPEAQCVCWRVMFSPAFWEWAVPKLYQVSRFIEKGYTSEELNRSFKFEPYPYHTLDVRPLIYPTVLSTGVVIRDVRRYPFFFNGRNATVPNAAISVEVPTRKNTQSAEDKLQEETGDDEDEEDVVRSYQEGLGLRGAGIKLIYGFEAKVGDVLEAFGELCELVHINMDVGQITVFKSKGSWEKVMPPEHFEKKTSHSSRSRSRKMVPEHARYIFPGIQPNITFQNSSQKEKENKEAQRREGRKKRRFPTSSLLTIDIRYDGCLAPCRLQHVRKDPGPCLESNSGSFVKLSDTLQPAPFGSENWYRVTGINSTERTAEVCISHQDEIFLKIPFYFISEAKDHHHKPLAASLFSSLITCVDHNVRIIPSLTGNLENVTSRGGIKKNLAAATKAAATVLLLPLHIANWVCALRVEEVAQRRRERDAKEVVDVDAESEAEDEEVEDMQHPEEIVAESNAENPQSTTENDSAFSESEAACISKLPRSTENLVLQYWEQHHREELLLFEQNGLHSRQKHINGEGEQLSGTEESSKETLNAELLSQQSQQRSAQTLKLADLTPQRCPARNLGGGGWMTQLRERQQQHTRNAGVAGKDEGDTLNENDHHYYFVAVGTATPSRLWKGEYLNMDWDSCIRLTYQYHRF